MIRLRLLGLVLISLAGVAMMGVAFSAMATGGETHPPEQAQVAGVFAALAVGVLGLAFLVAADGGTP